MKLPSVTAPLSVALAFSTGAAARDICWIESITRTKEGVEIRLFHDANATYKTPGRPLQSLRLYAKPPNDGNANATAVPYISAKLGDSIHLISGVHASCTLIVATTGNQIGVVASATQVVPAVSSDGSPLIDSVSKFIPAK